MNYGNYSEPLDDDNYEEDGRRGGYADCEDCERLADKNEELEGEIKVLKTHIDGLG